MSSVLERLRWPIRLQLMAWVVLVVGLILVALGTFRYNHFSVNMTQIIITDVKFKTREVEDYLQELEDERRANKDYHPLRLNDPEALPDSFSHDGIYIQLTRLNGEVAQRSPNLGDYHLPARHRAATEIIHLALPGFERSHRLLMVTKTLSVH